MGSYYLIGGEQPQARRQRPFRRRRPTARSRPSNGKIYMAVANQKLFADTCKALGHPEWATDPRFAAAGQPRGQQARARRA